MIKTKKANTRQASSALIKREEREKLIKMQFIHKKNV